MDKRFVAALALFLSPAVALGPAAAQDAADYPHIVGCPMDTGPATCDRSADGWWVCSSDKAVEGLLGNIELKAYDPGKAYFATVLACTYLDGIVTTKEAELLYNDCMVDEAIGAFRCRNGVALYKAVAGPLFETTAEAEAGLGAVAQAAEASLWGAELTVAEVGQNCDCDTSPCPCDEPRFAATAFYLDYGAARKFCARLDGGGVPCHVQQPAR